MAPRAYLHGDTPVLGPVGVAVTGIGTSPVAAIAADFLRHGILFHNPNAAAVLRVLPVGATLVSGAGGIVLNPYSTFMILDSDGGNAVDDNSLMRVNCAWNVVADAAGPFGLTVWNFTDSNPAVAVSPERVMFQNMDIDIASPNAFNLTGLTTASSTILPANRNRRGLLWHNPGTQNKAVAPANLAASMGAGSIVILPKAEQRIAVAGKVRINCGFTGVTANNADGALTVLEFV